MPSARIRRLPGLFILAAATILLTWRLGAVYLWQDEAATAVLADRMLLYGRPLAYDGRNLITMDSFSDEDSSTIDSRTGSATAEIQYLVQRRDFKADGTWIGQPWGQFAVAALSLSVFGHSTAAARAPFAAAAILTVMLLYALSWRLFKDHTVAWLAAFLLIANALWIAHCRQCRYYALSSLCLLASVAAFSRWRRGASWGAPLFIAIAWTYFQCDFGSFFPVMAVLLAVALVSDWPRLTRSVTTFAVLGALVAPFAAYYEIAGRVRNASTSFDLRLLITLLNLNQYLIAFPILVAACFLVWRKRASLERQPRDVLLLVIFFICALALWVPLVAPYPFHRYVVGLTPLGALLSAWVIVQAADALAALTTRSWLRSIALSAGVALIAFSDLISAPVTLAINSHYPEPAIRPEVTGLLREVFLPRPDPNRDVIELLAPRLRPDDEVLVNYEDIPFMFYTGARIRGGVAAFRVEDRTAPPPRFLVLRRTVPFVHWPVFIRERDRYLWRPIETTAPDIPYGNNPDPTFFPFPYSPYRVVVAERVGP